MIDFFSVMHKPLIACFILTGIHAYLGMHVIKREIIFVDLSLAQIAALGAVIALLVGYEPHSRGAYWLSLVATLGGAVILSLTRTKRQSLPQEAIIGMIYVVSAALAILLLQRSPEGDEHMRHMLVGNVLLVGKSDLFRMLVVYSVIGLLHFVFRKHFFEITIAKNAGLSKKQKLWDLVFYLTFGVVVTSSVEIVGVLLVFSFLIMPSAFSLLLTRSIRAQLILGWIYGCLMSFFGIGLSYVFDLPTGATIVCVFGFSLCFIGIARKLVR